MAIESDGHSRGNPRIFELIENAPKVGKSPTIWAWPEVVDWLRVAGQPVPGPWPPHQQRRPEPEEESIPTAVVEPERAEPARPAADDKPSSTPSRPSAPPARSWPGGADDESSPPRHGRGLLDT
ncbi:MAG: hypothetical protein ACRDS9_00820 [Pseudonocardiaceae bacterium]